MIANKIVNSHYGPMMININDQYIGRSLEIYGCWAKEDIEVIASLVGIIIDIKGRAVFYDVGANIGTHTVAMARTFGDKISVRSFEAQRQIYYLLCGNLALNGLDNVIAYHAAVNDIGNGGMQIALPDYNLPNNFGGLELIQPQRSDNHYMTKQQFETVATVKIDQFDEAVDFIKMDIEGMEHLALAGAQQTIHKHRPVCFVEMWKTDLEAVKKFFQQADYVAYEHKLDDWVFFPRESPMCLINKTKIEL